MNVADFKRYLLGDLPATDSEAIDLYIISEKDSEEKLSWAECELIEDYLDETLTPAEIKLFNENFLVSPERRAQLKQLSILKDYARRAAAKGAAEDICETPLGFLEKLKEFLSLNRRPAAVALTLLVIGLFGIYYFTADKQTSVEREFAALNRKDLSDLAKFKDVLAVNLIAGNFRGGDGAGNKLSLERLGDKVLFRLALPVLAEPPNNFKIELVNNGKVIFTQTELPAYANSNGRELRLLLPAALLEKSEYQIKAFNETAKDSYFVYGFAVR